jgi:hypothetical protein
MAAKTSTREVKGLDDELPTPAPRKPTFTAFKVGSGSDVETIGVARDVLDRWPRCALSVAAQFAERKNVPGPLSTNYEDPIIWERPKTMFVILTRYMETGCIELPLEFRARLQLLHEARFWNLDGAVGQIVAGFSISELKANDTAFSDFVSSVVRAKDAGVPEVKTETKEVKRDTTTVLQQVLDDLAKSGADNLKGLQEFGERLLACYEPGKSGLDEVDAKNVADEYEARNRLTLGKTHEFKLVELFDAKGCSVPALPFKGDVKRGTGYPIFRALEAPWVVSAAEYVYVRHHKDFNNNLAAITLGVFGQRGLDGLPVVIAGGAVLAALHEWPYEASDPPLLFPAVGGDEITTFLTEHKRRRRGEGGESGVDTSRMLPERKAIFRALCAINARPGPGIDNEVTPSPLRALLAGTNQNWIPRRDPRHLPSVAEARAFSSMRHTDIDLFLTTRDSVTALATIETIASRVSAVVGEVRFMRTAHSVTLIVPRPWRNVQIVLRLYDDPAHVLLGFDIDCCAVCVDAGGRVFAAPRALRALERRSNIVDPTRQSTTYESRLHKYAMRDFSVSVPGINLGESLGTILRALRFTQLDTRKIDYRTLGHDKSGKSDPAPCHLSRFLDKATSERAVAGCQRLWLLMTHSPDVKRLMPDAYASCSDYGVGRLISATKIIRNINQITRGNKRPGYAFGANIKEVLHDNLCVATASSRHGATFTTKIPGNVSKKVEFVKDRPHLQDRRDNREVILFTGSFHAVDGDWYA